MAISKPTILVLGASGMLGNALVRLFADDGRFHVVGTVRSEASIGRLPERCRGLIIAGAEVCRFDSFLDLMTSVKPDIVVNAIGLVKQLADAKDPIQAISLNALFPHRLARLCAVAKARFIHISTDCVFDGKKGMYVEEDIPDAVDIYGRTKLLGEVDYTNAITLRTSIIGHEISSSHALIDWFLKQKATVSGFRRAIFSGLPTVCLAEIIRDNVIENPDLRGLYHVSAEPISKYDLLMLVKDIYGHSVEIVPDDTLDIDRSLDSSRFRRVTGFSPPTWPQMIARMRDFERSSEGTE